MLYVAESNHFPIVQSRNFLSNFPANKPLDALVKSAQFSNITEFAQADRNPERPAFSPTPVGEDDDQHRWQVGYSLALGPAARRLLACPVESPPLTTN